MPDAPVPPISDEALAQIEKNAYAVVAHNRAHVLNRDVRALIARLRDAEARALPDGQVRLGDHRVYRVADHWEGVIAGHRVALLIPLPATPEEDDDGE